MELIELLNTMNEPNPTGYVTIVDNNEAKQFPGEIKGTARNLLWALDKKVLYLEVEKIRQDTYLNTFPVLHIFLKED